MSETQSSPENKIEDQYIDPELIEPELLEKIMMEGEIKNIHSIEEHLASMPKHADRVLIGETHHDMLLEAVISIPDENRTLLVVYKPESGINKGNDNKEPLNMPDKSSPYMQKEVATWIIAQQLGMGYLAMPVVIRSLNEGAGSIRPYIQGEPLELLTDEETDRAINNKERLEHIALFDYIINNLDRRLANLLWQDDGKDGKLKLIDHSLTFFSDEYGDRFEKRGPRVMIAYDNSFDPPKLKRAPINEDLLLQIDNFIKNEETIRKSLTNLLTKTEIDGIFSRAKKAQEQKIFL